MVAPVSEGCEILRGKVVFFVRVRNMLLTSEFFGNVVVLKMTFSSKDSFKKIHKRLEF